MPTRLYLRIAAIVATGSSLILPPRHAVAQGALDVARPSAPAPASASQPAARPARSVLGQLAGRWRFVVWFAGNFDGPPDASGTRVIEPLYDDLRLQWTEELDHSGGRSQGIIGFDPRTERFYSSTVYSESAGPEFLSGTLSATEPLITFAPLTPTPATDRARNTYTFTLIDADHFTWVPLDRGWRAVFTRAP